ncbi:MAG TPA: HD domain-containing protein [Candidatus Levybacteria bacterium]|nr:HD domain-containing protein [Candidatus Levybacteria bacterium]
MNTFKDLLEFVSFTHQYQQVKRAILATGENRDENDAEHSYQLAMVAWYVVKTRKLKLDIDKVIKYALTHDLVEVYANDTPFHTKDKTLLESKQQREHDALEQIATNFAEFGDMKELIKKYEEKIDEEAKFVYALDKILPVMNIYLDNGKTWKRDDISYKQIRTKDEKIKVSEEAEKLWKELLVLLDKNKHMFP